MNRKCFAIIESQFVEGKGYIPSLIVENEPGHQPFVGNGDMAEPWYWGMTLDRAKACADQANASTFGLTRAEAKEIVDSSIIASIREDAAQASYEEHVDRQLGRR